MNLDDIEDGLPNGLHDSRMHTYSSVADERRAEFVLDVWVGDLHSTSSPPRVLLRRNRTWRAAGPKIDAVRGNRAT